MIQKRASSTIARLLHCALLLSPLGCDGAGTTRASSTPSTDTPPPPASTTPSMPSTTSSETPSATPRTAVDAPRDDAAAAAAGSNNTFGFDLYRRVRTEPGNLAISPASISMACSMALAGAKGETATEIATTLRLRGEPAQATKSAVALVRSLENPDLPFTFRMANQLFAEQSWQIDPAFVTRSADTFGAPLARLDFKTKADASRKEINLWIAGQTQKRIESLLPPNAVTSATRIVLVNAVYFLGDWTSPFEKDRTSAAAFTLAGGKKIDVTTMRATQRFRFTQNDEASAIELPYKGDRLSMVLVVPRREDGIGALETSLDATKLDTMTKAMTEQTVFLSLPKFEIDPQGSMVLTKTLGDMGIRRAFDPAGADFSPMGTPGPDDARLHVSGVFHKAFVKVDEKGTEAAAATAVGMDGGAAPQKLLELRADRPFLFFIRERKSGLVLFMGRVLDPSRK